ncbi:DNA mismatch repair protein MutS [Mucor mucedo]|uniref:DNA mismatch repair protein MutS n=1 Tax=Mucor mucedo TaxID=29922 RepID=UPI0022202F3B|nr:DNA mismatch repair protein MutS [Mucor mucedo]KAI7893163.1 DNA mismatch repair protein MutS [Mucor mucedo]
MLRTLGKRTIAVSKCFAKPRSFIASRPTCKTISKINLSELVLETETNTPIKPLEAKEISTGSVVLDTVREYTKKYPLCVLLVQVGDFYELYESHASRYAPQLDLKLTKKTINAGNVVDFAGFPLRALDRYLDILVNRLQCKVALCEQFGSVSRDDKSIIGIQRKITRIITPGTVIEERFLESNQYNYLLSVFPNKDSTIGLAWVDVSVGEFVMQQTTLNALKDDIARIRPREVILPESMKPSDALLQQGLFDQDVYDPVTKLIMGDSSIAISYEADIQYNAGSAIKTLQNMFKNAKLEFSQVELAASMALMMYVNETHINRKPKWQKPTRFSMHDSVCIDSAAMASLEIVRSLQGRRTDSLIGVLDCTSTSAGSRLLTRWLSSPLTSIDEIRNRLDIVEYFKENTFTLDGVRNLLRQSTDAQRAIQRLALKRGQHSDLMEVWYTLDVMRNIHDQLQDAESEATQTLLMTMDPHKKLADYIRDAFDHQKIQAKDVRDYGYVNHKFHPALSQLHNQLDQLETQRLNLQNELRALCGNSLSLMTDGPFKHIIEVSTRKASNLLDMYPQALLINQTKSRKRYQVEEWTDISVRLTTVQSQIIEIESEVFDEVVDKLLDQSATILQSCRKLAQLDVLTSFSQLARQNDYVRPRITRANRTMIVGGRHPVVEANLSRKGQTFVPNDCDLGSDQRIWLLTGPNMGGKSTFLRQHVIIVLMAHMGCFVPADRAWIGITDRIFSRVGAADNLAQNQSTFMVEMSEVSTILRQATARSTVIMDEVGRGTSTIDGFSLAFGILDFLHSQIKCRTIYATHYHELADTMTSYDNIKFYRTGIEETPSGGFRFIHKVEPGICRQSHGLKVAHLAGIPKQVIDKAEGMWNCLQKTPPHHCNTI